MMTLSLSQAMSAAPQLIGGHLWQSTIVALVAGLLTLALKGNRAQARYGLWLAASLKFLVPFAALAAIGRAVADAARAQTTILASVTPQLSRVVDATSRRFSWIEIQTLTPSPPTGSVASHGGAPLVLFAIWLAGCVVVLIVWTVRWRRVARLARDASGMVSGRELDILRRVEQTAGIKTPLTIAATPSVLEPCVFGVFAGVPVLRVFSLRGGPVLLWPSAVSAHLDDRHIETILAHEVSHVRRRDNLAAAVHMAVEAIFWFHPLVWWIGARMVDERERACDESVLLTGRDPALYAEGILKTCRLAVESPLPCLAGVTGSDLEKRIERIMTNDVGTTLTELRRLLLAAAGAAALVAPIVTGALAAPRPGAGAGSTRAFAFQAGAQSSPEFEVASVKPNKSGDGRVMLGVQPGGRFTATNVTLRMLIRNAYQLQDFQISGGPGWLNSDHFDIVAKADGDLGDAFQAEARREPSRLQLMLRALLAERFKLAVHTDNVDMPIYALVLARNDGRLGPQLKRSEIDCQAMMAAAQARGSLQGPPAQPGQRQQCGMRIRPGNLSGGGVALSQLSNTLSMFAGRIVQDRTALAGTFDVDLTWTPDQMPQRPPGAPEPPQNDPNGPSIFTAVQEQLGLKLDSQKGPIDVLVIDHAEPPTPN